MTERLKKKQKKNIYTGLKLKYREQYFETLVFLM